MEILDNDIYYLIMDLNYNIEQMKIIYKQMKLSLR